MSESIKPVWSILTAKAERELRGIQNKRDNALNKKNAASQRKDKIDKLLVEYSNRLNRVLERNHSQDESTHYRQFIIHLHNLCIFGSLLLPWRSGNISPLLRSSIPGATRFHTYGT